MGMGMSVGGILREWEQDFNLGTGVGRSGNKLPGISAPLGYSTLTDVLF